MSAENKTEILITIPQRGVRVSPPTEVAVKIAMARNGQRISPWTEQEKIELQIIIDSHTLKRRYPNRHDGLEFMQHVDYERRNTLLGYAKELSSCIVEKWETIAPEKPIAIVLFGSIARGLVKSPHHPDPSNIDLAVIGDFSEQERLDLFDAIRPKRLEMKREILSDCPNFNYNSTECSGNAGVHIQRSEKLIKNNFSLALEYMEGTTISLHDPSGIWEGLQKQAISYVANRNSKVRR